ncbi:MAG: glutamyl-tRNA reductase, partial [Microbacterium sp.]|nr:glutamyl-tRNA reductase [Microbacterium sp.]
RGDVDGRVEQSLRHLAGVLLHTPTTRAHELAEAGRADDFATALETLFGLAPAAESAQDPGSAAAS